MARAPLHVTLSGWLSGRRDNLVAKVWDILYLCILFIMIVLVLDKNIKNDVFI